MQSGVRFACVHACVRVQRACVCSACLRACVPGRGNLSRVILQSFPPRSAWSSSGRSRRCVRVYMDARASAHLLASNHSRSCAPTPYAFTKYEPTPPRSPTHALHCRQPATARTPKVRARALARAQSHPAGPRTLHSFSSRWKPRSVRRSLRCCCARRRCSHRCHPSQPRWASAASASPQGHAAVIALGGVEVSGSFRVVSAGWSYPKSRLGRAGGRGRGGHAGGEGCALDDG